MEDLTTLSTEQLEQLLQERKAAETKKRKEERDSYERLRDQTVRALMHKAKRLQLDTASFKKEAFSEMEALFGLLQEYSKRHQDNKGNFTLEDDSGTLRIRYSTNETGFFDERSQQAEQHIIDFINREFEQGGKMKKLVTSLLERKKGHLDIKLVQRLYAMEDDFEDESWKEGIKLLKESWTPGESRQYINFYEKKGEGWVQVVLNFSAI